MANPCLLVSNARPALGAFPHVPAASPVDWKPLWCGQNLSCCAVLAPGRVPFPIRLWLLQESVVLDSPLYPAGQGHANSGHPINVDWMNEICHLSHSWRPGSHLPEMSQTSSLISLGFSPHLLSCNHQPVLCLSCKGRGEGPQEGRWCLSWIPRWE